MKSTIYSFGILNLNKEHKGFIKKVNRYLQTHRSRYWGMYENLTGIVQKRLLSAFYIDGNTIFFVTNPEFSETIVLLPTECKDYNERMCLL